MSYKLEFSLSAELEKYRDRIEATIKPYIEITIENNDQVDWWQSKFGGLPYLPKGFEYPKTPNGEHLLLLAQINFAEVPHLKGFPEKGILQFYLPDDDLYGLSCDPDIEDIFRVLYFSEPDYNVENLITNYDFLHKPEFFPVCGCCSLQFTKKYAPISESDYRFTNLLGEDFEELFRSDDQIWNEYIEISSPGGHKIGGYHDSFQTVDPRGEAGDPENNHPEYILLFQIDEEINDVIGILWGDGGICNFFIQESALNKLEFSDVFYHWDCG